MENIPLKPQPVNWEAVRVLAVAIGVREAARRLGISAEAAMKRSQREGWLADPATRAARAMSEGTREGMGKSPALMSAVSAMSAKVVSVCPAAVMQAELQALGGKSRISLARGVAKAAETVENLSGNDILDRSADVKSLAQTADLVHGWKESAPQVKIRLDLLGEAGSPVVDIEATTSLPGAAMGQCLDDWDDAAECSSDDVEDY